MKINCDIYCFFLLFTSFKNSNREFPARPFPYNAENTEARYLLFFLLFTSFKNSNREFPARPFPYKFDLNSFNTLII